MVSTYLGHMLSIADRLHFIATQKWKIPTTWSDAFELATELHQIRQSDPERFKELDCAPELHFGGIEIDGSNPNFDFSDLNVDGITVKMVRFDHNAPFFINSAIGPYFGHYFESRDGDKTANIFMGSDMILRKVISIISNAKTRLSKKLSSEYGLHDSTQILGAIEGLWLEGFQFDEYLPGSHEPINVEAIIKDVGSKPKAESNMIQLFRKYWMTHIVLDGLKQLKDQKKVDDYADFVHEFTNFVDKHEKVNECKNDLDCLYNIFTI